MKTRYIFPLAAIAALTSCSVDEVGIRQDLEELNSRLDEIETALDEQNTSINSLYDITVGTILVTDYTTNQNGDAILSLSDGTELLIHCGLPDGEIPTLEVNEEGYWTYTYDYVTTVLTDAEGNPVSARPADGTDGHVPYVSINENGEWCYSLDGKLYEVGGKYGYADISAIPGSIFADVQLVGNILKIKAANNSYTEIPLLGGLNISFSDTPLTISAGTSTSITATLTEVAKVIVDPSPLKVTLTDDASNNLTIDATYVYGGTHTLYFQIFSVEGYRRVVSLEVTISE